MVSTTINREDDFDERPISLSEALEEVYDPFKENVVIPFFDELSNREFEIRQSNAD